MTDTTARAAAPFISADDLLAHWQGHRALTRRVIEAFPEDELFRFSIGGMRTFGALALELVAIAEPMARGLATGEWASFGEPEAETRTELLRMWDETTPKIEEHWARIPPDRFNETLTAFGEYTGTGSSHVLYAIDNEVHHRGQGYVYLRALGIEPPHFWER